MRLARILLFGVLGLVALAVAAVAVAVAVIDVNDFRAEIGAQVEAVTGRPLVIDGDIELDAISLRPGVAMNDVGFANAPWGTREDMIRFRRIELAIGLLPLLTGDIRFRRLALIEPDLLLETNASGKGNWILEAAAESADGGGTGLDVPFVSEIVIEDAAVTYQDGRTGEVIEGTLGDAMVRARGMDAPMRLEATGTLGEEDVRIAADLEPLSVFLAGERYGAALDLAMGASDLKGDVNVALRAVPVHIAGELSSKRLDLDRLIGGEDASEGADSRTFDDEHIRFGVLRSFDVTLDYDTDELVVGGQTFDAVSGRLRLRDGVLTVPEVAGDLAGAHLSGSMAVDASAEPTAARVDATLDGAKLEPITDGLIAGPLDVGLVGEGTGESLAAIMGSLSGRLTADIGSGRIDDTAFDFLSTDVLGAIRPWAPPERGIAVNCGVADFSVADGVASSRVLLLDTNRAYVIGRRGGTIDLREERVDLLVDPFTKKTSVATLIAVPLRVTGPIADPSVDPAPGEAIENVAFLPFDVVGSVIGRAVGTIESMVTGDESDAQDMQLCSDARAAADKQEVWPSGGAGSSSGGGVGGAIEGGIKGIGEGIESIFE